MKILNKSIINLKTFFVMNATISILRNAINARIQNEVSKNTFVDYRDGDTIEDFTVKIRLQQSELTNETQRDFFERFIAFQRFENRDCFGDLTFQQYFDAIEGGRLLEVNTEIKQTSFLTFTAQQFQRYLIETRHDEGNDNFFLLNIAVNFLNANEILNDYRNALRDFQRGNGGAINERLIAIENSLDSINETICMK